ncbi:hypothetical protein M1583_00010 [Candidatus Marsarchaeota archaeon]|nr:hypothetical protein [Candidatus Marsarchaeota archaeon]
MKINLIVDKYHNDRYDSIRKAFERDGFEISTKDYALTVFVGGDGTFANGALEFISKPVLFLSRHWKRHNGSISYNSQANVDSESLSAISKRLNKGDYRIREEPVLYASYKGKKYFSIYDFFVERFGTKEALRYRIKVSDGKSAINLYSISNGLIITTSLGSTGYYSYMDILENGKPKPIPKNRIGLCHILPVKIEETRKGVVSKGKLRKEFGIGSKFEVFFERDVDPMLFGMPGNDGVRITGKAVLRFGVDKERKLKMIEL